MEKMVKTNTTTRTRTDIGKSQATAHCSAEMPGSATPISLGPLPSGVRPSPAKRAEADSSGSMSQPIILTDTPASQAGMTFLDIRWYWLGAPASTESETEGTTVSVEVNDEDVIDLTTDSNQNECCDVFPSLVVTRDFIFMNGYRIEPEEIPDRVGRDLDLDPVIPAMEEPTWIEEIEG